MSFEKSLLQKKLLVVDDDYSLNQTIKEILSSYNFTNINIAYSLKQGQELFEKENNDLIILDVTLPDGTGYELAQKIRQYSDVPILFLTAKNDPEDEIYGFTVGGDDYITKPFLPRTLIFRIIALLKRTYKDEMSNVIFSNAEVDFKQAIVVQSNGESIPLTRTEFQILKKLYDNKNYIVSIESLCETVWGIEHFGYEKSLMVHIRNIREKIEMNPSKPEHLITVKGLGYKLCL